MLSRMFVAASFAHNMARARPKHDTQANENNQKLGRNLQGKKTMATSSTSTQIDTTTLVPPDQLCAAYMLFDSISYEMKKKDHNFEWSDACAPFETLNYQICPYGVYLRGICYELPHRAHMNPSVRYEYCESIFSFGIAHPRKYKLHFS
mmetsp:Transcript_18700/g.38434  ORF Transcript_18700/g.38434 Transcript_18700/m.38434 type:complete len:149 (-) Transcript_18700:316-762(-)